MLKKLLISTGALLSLLLLAQGAKAQNYTYDCMCLYSDPNGSCIQYTCNSYQQPDYNYNNGCDGRSYNGGSSRCGRSRPVYYNDSYYNNRSNDPYYNNQNYYNSSYNNQNYYNSSYNNQYYDSRYDYNWYYRRYGARTSNYPSYNNGYYYNYYNY